jgi:hypothetical protein
MLIEACYGVHFDRSILRTTCHLSWMLVAAWSCEVSVPVLRSGDHTAPPFGDNRGTQAFWAMYVEAMN